MSLVKIWIAYQTLVRKELIRIFRIWSQTLLPPAITMTLYFLIFGQLIGSQLRDIDGFSYIQYIVPGLIMMSVITNSYIHTSSAFFSIKFQRSIEELLVSPMPNIIILLGFISGALIRSLIVAFIVTCIALLFTHLTLHHWFLMLLIIVSTSVFFATLGLINGIFAKTFDDISWVPTFLITPLTYLGGVFFSINMLPGFWQKIAYFNPVLYIIDIFRYSVLGIISINVEGALSALLIIMIIAFYYALRLIRMSPRLRN